MHAVRSRSIPARALIATAATGGVLLAFGARLGAPLVGWRAIAALLVGAAAQRSTATILVAFLGPLLHFAIMLAWTTLHDALTRRMRGRSVLAAAIVAACALVAMRAGAALLHVGPAVILDTGQQILLCAALGVALAVGMRLALLEV